MVDTPSDIAIHFRDARREDLERMIHMLSDDPLGAKRECFQNPLHESYNEAFNAITDDPNNQFVSAICEHTLVGFLQLTFVPSLTYQGRSSAMIEGVRIHKSILVLHAIEQARKNNCHLV